MECLSSTPAVFTCLDLRVRAFRPNRVPKNFSLATGNCSFKTYPSLVRGAFAPMFTTLVTNYYSFGPLSCSLQVDADFLPSACKARTIRWLVLLCLITTKTGSLSMPPIMFMGGVILSTNSYLIDSLGSVRCLKRILSCWSSYWTQA